MTVDEMVEYLWERERRREFVERMDAVERSMRHGLSWRVRQGVDTGPFEEAVRLRVAELRAEFGR